MAKKFKLSELPSRPTFQFSKTQLEACEKSKLIADRLAKMQTSGKFNYGYVIKDKQPLNVYNLQQHFMAAVALIKMTQTRSQTHDPYSNYNFTNCLIAADNAILWATGKYLQPVAGSKTAKLIVKKTVNLDASAAALLAISNMISYMVRNKFGYMVTWRLENHIGYVALGESLAQGLYLQLAKDGKIAAECNRALLLQALFAWVGACQSLSAWYNELKADGFATYKKRAILYKSLNGLIKDAASRTDEQLIAPLALALRNVGESIDYEKVFVARIKKLLLRAKDSNNMMAAMHFFSIFSSGDYKVDIDKITNIVEARLATKYKQIKKTGSVSKNGKVTIAHMQSMLAQLHDFAIIKPYYA